MIDRWVRNSQSWLLKNYGPSDQSLITTQDLADYQIIRFVSINSEEKLDWCLIINHTNLRYAKSVNQAASLVDRPLIWLLNNDVSPDSDCLLHLIKYFTQPMKFDGLTSQPDQVFAVGCLEIENSSAPDSPVNSPVWGGKNYLWFEKGLFHHSRADQYITGSTAWVSGGSGLFSTDKWRV